MTLDNIKEEIEKAQNIVLLTHESPDGDAIGSILAMYNSLVLLGKNVEMIVPEYSKTFAFLPSADKMQIEGTKEEYDLAIAVDSGDIKRLNGFAKYFENSKVTINIDHHGSNTMYADYNFVNPDAPACCQILVTVLEYIGVKINIDIGTCLVTGIITDTGGFKYPGTSQETFEFTSELLGMGVNVSEIYRRVLEVRSKANFELSKIAINRLELLEDGKIAFTYITKEDLANVEANPGDHEGLVNIGREIEGVEVSIFLREEDNGFKVSLRSNNYVNVSDVSLMFGGGGHMRAAGCTLNAPLDEVKIRIINEVKNYLK